MIILKADNRTVSRNTKFTFLSYNTLSNETILTITSTEGFAINDYILIGEFGQETTELRKALAILNSTQIIISTIYLGVRDSITTTDACLVDGSIETVTESYAEDEDIIPIVNQDNSTIFAHSESTKIARVLYDKVVFYWTNTAVFSSSYPLGTIDIDPQGVYTYYEDYTHNSGYGWFYFINSITNQISAVSNPIPYIGFEPNSARKIIGMFLSTLNNSDAKLISFEEAFYWLSEGYAMAYNELNLVNQEYSTPTVYELPILAGTQEYVLPNNFSKLISISDGKGNDIEYVKQKNVRKSLEGYNVGYYLRGGYIGFTPVPTSDTTYEIYYNAKSGYLDSFDDLVDMPNNNFYCMIDFMMYRGTEKLNKSDPEKYYKRFLLAINQMKLNSAKQNANQDSFEISPYANV